MSTGDQLRFIINCRLPSDVVALQRRNALQMLVMYLYLFVAHRYISTDEIAKMYAKD